MIFTSLEFLWLFPCLFLLYYGVCRFFGREKIGTEGNVLLLLLSYALYVRWNLWLTLVLLGVSLVTFYGAILLEGTSWRRMRIFAVWLLAGLTVAPLLYFKYAGFLYDNLSGLFSWEKSSIEAHLIAPLGIAFYSLQAVGYLMDVYRGDMKAERNVVNYMLFVSFFPQILAGPISRASDLLPQIAARRRFDYEAAVQGLRWMLWGMFLKVVLADRVGLYVDAVYGNYAYQSGWSCLVACLLYSAQIYGDFAGYSLLAIGVGRLMGFDLVNNFNRPYLAVSVTEFWHRWHISLTRWLTSYIYIGLGGNRCSRLRQYGNILVTFLVSGLWHGANWTFILWGGLHGVFQIVEKMTGLARRELTGWPRVVRTLVTFLLVSIAWVFFRMPTVHGALQVVYAIFTLRGSGLFLPGHSDVGYMLLALLLVGVKDVCNEFFPSVTLAHHRQRAVRWTCYVGLVMLILLCGVFDAGQFIYVQF